MEFLSRRSAELTDVESDTTSPHPPLPSTPRRWKWLRRGGYAVVNVWLLFHLTAIVTAPATVGPSSATARNVWDMVGPYLQGAYLNHGFHYFAPQPGSSNLVSWTVTLPDGETKSGVFPNFEIQPRLLYHRFFMLAEFLGNSDPETQQRIAKNFARCLCEQHDAVQVALSTIRHDLPTMERIRAGGRVDDPDLYEEQPLGVFDRDDLL